MDERVLAINGVRIGRGERVSLDLPIAKLYTHTPLTMPVQVVRGRRAGPTLFVSAAIHGDELNGVEIIRRLLALPALKRLQGTLIAIPVVNVYGLTSHSRYLPDRRDLNRSFPGSERGSLAARLAHLFMREIVEQCTHGIDLHTGALHRCNLPQIRARLDDAETLRLAQAFGVPLLINADVRDGSLRQATAERGIPMLVYEAGEALRFDEIGIRAGVRGIVRVMRALHMLPAGRARKAPPALPVIARANTWIRAPESGILRDLLPLGARVAKHGRLGIIADPFGERELEIRSPGEGIVIGRSNLPLANEGDALFNVARFDRADHLSETLGEFHELYQPALAQQADADDLG